MTKYALALLLASFPSNTMRSIVSSSEGPVCPPNDPLCDPNPCPCGGSPPSCDPCPPPPPLPVAVVAASPEARAALGVAAYCIYADDAGRLSNVLLHQNAASPLDCAYSVGRIASLTYDTLTYTPEGISMFRVYVQGRGEIGLIGFKAEVGQSPITLLYTNSGARRKFVGNLFTANWDTVEGADVPIPSGLVETFAIPLSDMGVGLLSNNISHGLSLGQVRQGVGCYTHFGRFCAAEYDYCVDCDPNSGGGANAPGRGGSPTTPNGGGGCISASESLSLSLGQGRAAMCESNRPACTGDIMGIRVATGPSRNTAAYTLRNDLNEDCTNARCIGCCGWLGRGGTFGPSFAPDCGCVIADYLCICTGKAQSCGPTD